MPPQRDRVAGSEIDSAKIGRLGPHFYPGHIGAELGQGGRSNCESPNDGADENPLLRHESVSDSDGALPLKVNTLAPESANSDRYCSGCWTIRCTSSGRSVSCRRARIRGAPKVRLGTKCPSITSTCSHSAPPATARSTCSRSRPRSALKTL